MANDVHHATMSSNVWGLWKKKIVLRRFLFSSEGLERFSYLMQIGVVWTGGKQSRVREIDRTSFNEGEEYNHCQFRLLSLMYYYGVHQWPLWQHQGHSQTICWWHHPHVVDSIYNTADTTQYWGATGPQNLGEVGEDVANGLPCFKCLALAVMKWNQSKASTHFISSS